MLDYEKERLNVDSYDPSQTIIGVLSLLIITLLIIAMVISGNADTDKAKAEIVEYANSVLSSDMQIEEADELFSIYTDFVTSYYRIEAGSSALDDIIDMYQICRKYSITEINGIRTYTGIIELMGKIRAAR